jgi:predicted lipid carrier protein YhbT
MHSLLFPLQLPLRILPDTLHAAVLARCFNHLMRGQTLALRLSEIEGKSIRIHIRDAQTRLDFRIHNTRLQPAFQGQPDVTISGNFIDFWQLATRQEDPDTLFFRRSLDIEGETETGVHIKNLLDALDYDWDAHFDAVLFPALAVVAKQLRMKVDRFINYKSHRRSAVIQG